MDVDNKFVSAAEMGIAANTRRRIRNWIAL